MYTQLFKHSLFHQESILFQFGNHICIDNGSYTMCHCGNKVFKKNHYACSECGSEIFNNRQDDVLVMTSPLLHLENHHVLLQKCYVVELIHEPTLNRFEPFITKSFEFSFDYLTLKCSLAKIEKAKLQQQKTFDVLALINDTSFDSCMMDPFYDEERTYCSFENRLWNILSHLFTSRHHYDFEKGIFSLHKNQIVIQDVFLHWFRYLLEDKHQMILHQKEDQFLLARVLYKSIQVQTDIFDTFDNIFVFPEEIYKKNVYRMYASIVDFLEKEIFCNLDFHPLWAWFLEYSQTHKICRLEVIYEVCLLFETTEFALIALEEIDKNHHEERFLNLKEILASLKQLKSTQWLVDNISMILSYEALEDIHRLYYWNLSCHQGYIIPFFEDIVTFHRYLEAIDTTDEECHNQLFSTMLALAKDEQQKKVIYSSYGMEYKVTSS